MARTSVLSEIVMVVPSHNLVHCFLYGWLLLLFSCCLTHTQGMVHVGELRQWRHHSLTNGPTTYEVALHML